MTFLAQVQLLAHLIHNDICTTTIAFAERSLKSVVTYDLALDINTAKENANDSAQSHLGIQISKPGQCTSNIKALDACESGTFWYYTRRTCIR